MYGIASFDRSGFVRTTGDIVRLKDVTVERR